MSRPRIALFGYNFPHKKTEDLLVRLFLLRYDIVAVLAADPVKLNIPPSAVRTKLRHDALLHPKVVAGALGVPYHVVPHNSAEAVELIRDLALDLGIVGGARILKAPVIDAFRIGVINFHPGLIPEARGLDAMLWSIRHGIPLGVTAHLIDRHVDAGKMLLRREIRLYPDDGPLDLSERLYEMQLELLPDSIAVAVDPVRLAAAEQIDPASPHNRKMSAEVELETLATVADYIGARLAAASAQKAVGTEVHGERT
jgi:phosphoribosylglycinamide formyltransferase-1